MREMGMLTSGVKGELASGKKDAEPAASSAPEAKNET
jgi:hypothetical protein